MRLNSHLLEVDPSGVHTIVDARKRLSKNFSAYEFQCSDGTPLWAVSPFLIEGLQKLRDEFGRASINSGFRTASFNSSLKKSSVRSKHLFGLAADVVFFDAPLEDVRARAGELAFGGIGHYPNWRTPGLHLDIVGSGRRWSG